MTIPICSPGNKSNTHHFVLTDDEVSLGFISVNGQMVRDPKQTARNPVNQSSLKTTQGNQKYDDQKPPYMKLVPIDWSGGRGSIEWELDTTKYADALRANTERTGKIIMGGRDVYNKLGTNAPRNGIQSLPGSMRLITLLDSRKYMAKRITPDANFTASEVWFWLRAIGDKTGDLTINLRADSAGEISSVLQTVTLSASELSELVSELCALVITSEAVTTPTYYWLELYSGDNDNEQNHWEVGCKEAVGTTYESDAGQVWADWGPSQVDLYYRLLPATVEVDGFLFKYKNVEYFLTKPSSGAPKLYQNGYRSAAASNAGQLGSFFFGSAPGWATNELVGCVVWAYAGTGSTEEQNWRTILTNAAASGTVDHDWLIEHDTTTEYAIVGIEKWIEITGHGLTAPPTSVLVDSQGIVRIGQGEAAAIMRMREYNNAGTWTREFNADGTNKAIYQEEYVNPSTGVMTLIKTNGDVSESWVATPAWVAPPGWSTTTYANTKTVGDTWERITGIRRYVDSSQDEVTWIFKEGVPWLLNNTTLDRAKLPELATIASYKNGYASCVLGSYLYLSIQNSVHRFFHPTMEDIGPTLGEGLPENRRGHCVALVGYPGRVIAAYDAGADGYSSVLATNGGSSWHELYRAPKGKRIRTISFQVIPGTTPDRLWILQGGELVWIPYPSDEFDPEHDPSYPYTHEAVIENAPMFSGLKDAYKFYKDMKLEAENLSEGTCWVEADYRMDGDTRYQTFPFNFTDIPFSESLFDKRFGANCKKLQVRLRLYSTDITVTAKVTAVIISGVTVIPPKFYFSTPCYINGTNLLSEKDDLTAKQMMDKLDEWSGRGRPLRLLHENPHYHDKLVWLMPSPDRPQEQNDEDNTYIATIVVQEA